MGSLTHGHPSPEFPAHCSFSRTALTLSGRFPSQAVTACACNCTYWFPRNCRGISAPETMQGHGADAKSAGLYQLRVGSDLAATSAGTPHVALDWACDLVAVFFIFLFFFFFLPAWLAYARSYVAAAQPWLFVMQFLNQNVWSLAAWMQRVYILKIIQHPGRCCARSIYKQKSFFF